MRKVIFMGIFIIPYLLYSQDQVPEKFPDGKSYHSGFELSAGFTYENYIYETLSKSELGIELSLYENKGYFSHGGTIELSWSVDEEKSDAEKNVDIANIGTPITNINNLSVSYDVYLNLFRGFCFQPKIGLLARGNLLWLYSLNENKEDLETHKVSNVILGNISAVSRVEIFTSSQFSFYLKGEYELFNYPKLPFNLKNNFTLGLGLSINV